MKKFPVIFFLLLFFIFPSEIFAASSVSIFSFPSSAIAGEEFNIIFNASGLNPDTQYNTKALGGSSFTEVDTWNFSWLQQNASWSNMPEFSSNFEGSASATVKARFDSDTVSGSKELKIRIRKIGVDPYYDSPVVGLSVTAVTPTPTPSPTPSPTTASTATSTSKPTSTPTSTPIKSPTPKPTSTPRETTSGQATSEEMTTPQSFVLGLEDKTAGDEASESAKEEKSFSLLPIVFIVAGLVCIGAALYLVFKKSKAYNEKSEENN